MILLTIGTNEPFDRLVKIMDEIAGNNKDIPFVAQVSVSNYVIKNMDVIGFLSPLDFMDVFRRSSLIVSHAGMGTILSALVEGKKIIVMPRRGSLKEANNDHQYATAKKLEEMEILKVAEDKKSLEKCISELYDTVEASTCIGQFASKQLIDSITQFINQ